MQSEAVSGNGPAGLCLPPVIDHRNLQAVLGPFERIRIRSFACQKQGLEFRQVIVLHQLCLGVFALNRPEGSGGGEHNLDLVIGYHPPECARIRRAHRFALKNYGGATLEQRSVDNIGMPDHPADIGCRPVDITGIDIVNVAHGPL